MTFDFQNWDNFDFLHQQNNLGCMYITNVNRAIITWIPRNEFKNITYLTRGGFGEVYKATWVDYHNEEVVLKKLHNSSDKISDILKEVNIISLITTTYTP